MSLGNLAVLGIMLVILAVYRRMDMNNRTLEKVRRYADKAREDLDVVVLEKVQNLKDLGIELEVHQKTAKEILKRSQGIEDNFKEKFAAGEIIAARLDEYDRVLEELVRMTRSAEENIGRIKEESAFTDSVAKKLREVSTRLEEQEARIPEVVSRFGEVNDAALRSAQDAVMDSAAIRIEEMTGIIEAASAKAAELELFMKTREAENRRAADRIQLDLQGLGERIIEKTGAELSRIEADYDSRLQEAAARGEALETRALAKLRDFFEEKMKTVTRENAARLDEEKKELGARLAELAGIFRDSRAETELALEASKRDSAARLDRERQELEGALADLAAGVQEAREEAGRDLETMRAEISAASGEFRAVVRETMDDLEAGLHASENAFQARIAEVGERSRELAESVHDRILAEIETKSAGLRREEEERNKKLLDSAAELRSRIEEELLALRKGSETGAAELRFAVRRFEEADASLREKTAEISSQSEALWIQASADLESLKDSMDRETRRMEETLQGFIRENEQKVVQAAENIQSRVVGDLESRLEDYEKNISYRFSRVDDLFADVENLEKNLREVMAGVSARLRDDYTRFGTEMQARRQADQEELELSARKLREEMDGVEKSLLELKTRAYDNVSEKLKVFEDDFFQDLRVRSADMEEKLLDWQSRVDGSLLALERKGSEERERVEKRYGEELKERFEESREEFLQQLAALEGQAEDLRSGFSAREEESAAAIADFQGSVRARLEEAIASSQGLIQEELQRYGRALEQEAAKHRKEQDGRLRLLAEELEERKKDLAGSLESLGSDVEVWQARVLQDLKASEAEVNNRFAGIKVLVSETVSGLRDEFSSQRDDLVLSTREERTEMKEELRRLGESVSSLREELRNGAEESLEEFRSRGEEAREEYQKKNMELRAEAEGKIRDLRAIIADTRTQFEASSQKLYGRMEESARLLSINLGEIERKQRNFVEQTKIFERADALKISLGESIEELKTEMNRVDARRKEMKDLETQLQKVRKLGEEVSEKMSRFTVEKRRIDALESDYSRLIGMSDAVEMKLRQISETDDGITAVQASLRGLETLQKDTEARFERLEKKKKILDVTTEGLDKNFALLGEMEKKLESLQREISQVPGSLEALNRRISQLAGGKEKADEAAKLLGDIDGVMKDLEKRMAQLQKIREWLAKTETRIEEVSREVQEQVKLLGTLLKDGSRSPKKEKGAPSMSARETVTKLARQGWTVEQIAAATKLSRGEVELILELTAN